MLLQARRRLNGSYMVEQASSQCSPGWVVKVTERGLLFGRLGYVLSVALYLVFGSRSVMEVCEVLAGSKTRLYPACPVLALVLGPPEGPTPGVKTCPKCSS